MAQAATMSDALIVARAIVTGLAVATAGVAPWVWLGSLNAGLYPEWPWAAAVVLLWIAAMLWWLGGGGPPLAWRAFRRATLRLWPPKPDAFAGENRASVFALIAIIAAIYLFWILATIGQPTPDISEFTTPAMRFSALLMGAFVSGVVEEAAYRGYMQSQLEARFGVGMAIAITSVVFALSHITHGLAPMLLMAPGYIMAAVFYGLLAHRTGSLVPGMVLHVLGDAAHTFFGVLGGDASLLMQSS